MGLNPTSMFWATPVYLRKHTTCEKTTRKQQGRKQQEDSKDNKDNEENNEENNKKTIRKQ
jgi:hypothetical protein